MGVRAKSGQEGGRKTRAPGSLGWLLGSAHLPSAVWLTAVTNSPRTSWTHPPFHPGQRVWGQHALSSHSPLKRDIWIHSSSQGFGTQLLSCGEFLTPPSTL